MAFCTPALVCQFVAASFVIVVVVAAVFAFDEAPAFDVLLLLFAPPFAAGFVSLVAPLLATPAVVVTALVEARPVLGKKACLSFFDSF